MMTRIAPVSRLYRVVVCADTDTEIVEIELSRPFILLLHFNCSPLYNDEVLLARIEQFLRSLRDTFELGRDS